MWKNRSFCGYVYDRKWDRESVFVVDRESEIEKRVFSGGENFFFFWDFNATTPQRHSSPHTHTHTLTLTNTRPLSHTHDWPTMASRSSGSRGVFFRVLQIFWTTSVQQEFLWLPGGLATYENIILRELIVSFIYVSIFTQASRYMFKI